MKKTLTLTLTLLSAILTLSAVVPPEGSFTWNNPVPLLIDYRDTASLRLSSSIDQFSVTYHLKDPTMAQYISLNGNVATVLNCYAGDNEETKGRIYIQAHVSGMTQYDDTIIETYIITRKIYPVIQWTCSLTDMPYGSSVLLSATHNNTDRPTMGLTYNAVDYESSPSAKVSINQSTSMMKAVDVGNGIYIIAKIDSTDNFKATTLSYLRDDSIVRFNVVKAYRNILWNKNDFASMTNLSGDVPLVMDYDEKQDSVTIVSDNPQVAYVLPGNVLHIIKEGRIKLTATVGANAHYLETVSDTVIDISIAQTTVAWDESFIRQIENTKAVTSTTCGLNLNFWARSNYGDTARFVFSVPLNDQDKATVTNDTSLCCFAEGEFQLDVYAYAFGGTSPLISRRVSINRGKLQFVKAGLWSDINCWSRSDLADRLESYNVEILNQCEVRSDSLAECQGMVIYANGNVTVEPGGLLVVHDTLINYGGTRTLYLKADQHRVAQAIVSHGNPDATVEIYLAHSLRPGRDTLWCRHGVLVTDGILKSNSGHLTVRQWNESKGVMENCPMMTQGYKVEVDAWRGYMIADTLPGVYAVEGKLIVGDQTLPLAYTSGKRVGMNYVANSYTSPLAFDALGFENMNSELFDYVDGQYQTLPKFTAFTLGKASWLPGHVLFAQAHSADSRVNISHNDAVAQAPCEQRFNMLRIAATSLVGNKRDTVTLMAADNCSPAFDDGYDGTKIEGDDLMPMIYANNTWGKACVNVEQSIVGQCIGFKAGREDEEYTISFDTHGLTGYDQLYLFDTKTQKFIDIIGGERYVIMGTVLDEPNRFTIMRDKVEAKKDKYGRSIVVMGNKVLLVGFDNTNTPLRVMNMEGKIVCEFNTQNGPWFELPPLLNGIYIINAEQCSTKFYR